MPDHEIESRPSTFSTIRRLLIAAGAVALVVFIVYLPCLKGGFLDWDDDKNILQNPSFRGLRPANLYWMFTTTHMGPYQPLSWLTLAVDYSLWGMDPRGYHLTNVLLHAIGAGVMCLTAASLLAALGRHGPRADGQATVGVLLAAAVTSLAWALHPQRVESVAWVTERRDVLSGVFYLLCVWSYLNAHRAGLAHRLRLRWERSALICCVLALLSKATAVSLPAILLVLDVYPLRRLKGPPRDWLRPPCRHVVAEKFNYFLFCLLAVIVGFIGQSNTGAIQSLARVGPAERLAIAFHSVIFYLCKTFWPSGLLPLYPRPAAIHLADPRFLGSVLSVAVVSVVAVRMRRRWPGLLGVWICYVVALLPVCGLITIGDELVADRYSYLPTMSLFVLFDGILLSVWAFEVRRFWQGVLRAACVAAAAGAVTACAWEARSLMPVWHDSLALWTYVAQRRPDSYKAWNNLAGALLRTERYPDAERACRKAIEIKPDYPTGLYNLGLALIHQGRHEQAREALTEALRLDPDYAYAHAMLGTLLIMWMHRPAEAIEHLEAGLRLDPKGLHRTCYLLGEAYRQIGNYDAAIRSFNMSIKTQSNPRNTIVNLAALTDVYLSLNRIDLAETAAARIASVASGWPDGQYALAQVRCRQGRIDEALQQLQRALKAKPFLRDRARTDPHLENVRANPRFERMMSDLHAASQPPRGPNKAVFPDEVDHNE
jgi:tetratricopeptide (TPR) repeat protein